MVLAYHLIICAYGFWLPNDPRGSWSDFIGAWELLKFGRATTVTTHRSLAKKSHDREARLAAKRALKYPPVIFSGRQANAIARAIAGFAQKNELTILAGSILPDHVHLVIARHAYRIEQVANLLKGECTRQFVEESIHPLARFGTEPGPPPKAFARGQWAVFLDSDEDIRRSIGYVEDNPTREGLRRQTWSFVTPFAGLKPGIGGTRLAASR
ncbi:MAG: transposase [Phycisphaerales bacterium]|nr:transposase [Phycisphaerales bacterium]MCI0631999.1 transposase [Phycisphaerales bacterium]